MTAYPPSSPCSPLIIEIARVPSGLYPGRELSRGLTAVQVKAQGSYISDKIDLLIEYLLVDPFQSLFRRAFKQDVRALSPTMPQAQRLQEVADLLLPCGAAGVSVWPCLETSRLPARSVGLRLSLRARC